MAVAPDSSFTKRAKRVFMSWLLKVHTWLSERDPAAVFSGRLDHSRRYQREISMGLNRSEKLAVYGLFRNVVNNQFAAGRLAAPLRDAARFPGTAVCGRRSPCRER
jgi:hypothetical protein